METREWSYVRKDGSRFPVTLVVTAMRDDDGELLGYLGIALDITQRKAAEQRLAESLETTRAVLDTAVNPVLTFDEQGRILSGNPAALTAFDYSAEALLKRNIDELLAAQSRAAFASLVEGYIKDAGPGGSMSWNSGGCAATVANSLSSSPLAPCRLPAGAAWSASSLI